MIKWLRWLAVIPAALLGWVAAFAFGLVELRLIDAFCPPDQWVSGMCGAPWYEQAFSVAECLGAAVAAFLVVTLSSIMAPSHHKTVSVTAFAVGAAFAIYFGISGQDYAAMSSALLAGLLAVTLVAKLTRGRDPRSGNVA